MTAVTKPGTPDSGQPRIHVAPPLNLSTADAATGLAILDEALSASYSYAA